MLQDAAHAFLPNMGRPVWTQSRRRPAHSRHRQLPSPRHCRGPAANGKAHVGPVWTKEWKRFHSTPRPGPSRKEQALGRSLLWNYFNLAAASVLEPHGEPSAMRSRSTSRKLCELADLPVQRKQCRYGWLVRRRHDGEPQYEYRMFRSNIDRSNWCVSQHRHRLYDGRAAGTSGALKAGRNANRCGRTECRSRHHHRLLGSAGDDRPVFRPPQALLSRCQLYMKCS